MQLLYVLVSAFVRELCQVCVGDTLQGQSAARWTVLGVPRSGVDVEGLVLLIRFQVITDRMSE